MVLHFNVLSRPNIIKGTHSFCNKLMFSQTIAYRILLPPQILSSTRVCGEPEQSPGNNQKLLHSEVKCQQGQEPKMAVFKMKQNELFKTSNQ